jgi:G:T/U-mismatch repair DNA glycosylase
MQALGTATGIGQTSEEQETMQMLHRFFSYAAQNPQHYPQMRAHMIQEDMLDPEDLPPQMTQQQLQQAAGRIEQMSGGSGGGVGDALASMGRGGDNVFAHINSNEAQLLSAVGGAGSINPMTGQPEYLKKFFKKFVKPLVGAAIGFWVGGPVGAAVGASGGYALQQQEDLAKAQMTEARRQSDAILAAQQAEAERMREAENRRQANISEGQGIISSAFGQFDDGFFGNRSQSYIDYATPQLDRQYNDAMQSLVRSLARGGNLNSSLRAQSMADLQRQRDKGMLTIADQANRYANDSRSAIEASRSNLISQNANLADPGAVRALTDSQVSSLSAGQNYSPLQTLISALSRSSGTTPGGLPATKSKQAVGVDLFASAPTVATGTSIN